MDVWRLSRQGIAAPLREHLAKGVNPDHVRKLRQILQAAQPIEALNLPTFRLHPLTGDLEGLWSITVRANGRVVFRFEHTKAFDIALVDQH